MLVSRITGTVPDFSPFYKPYGQYFDLCAKGRLLLLSPYEYHTGNQALTRVMCNDMNLPAMAIQSQEF